MRRDRPSPASSPGPGGRRPPCRRPAPARRPGPRCCASSPPPPAPRSRPSPGRRRCRAPCSRPRRRTAPRPWPSRRRPGARPCRRLSRGGRVPSPLYSISLTIGRPGRPAGPAPALRGRGDIARHVSVSRPPRALRRRWHPPPDPLRGEGHPAASGRQPHRVNRTVPGTHGWAMRTVMGQGIVRQKAQRGHRRFRPCRYPRRAAGCLRFTGH